MVTVRTSAKALTFARQVIDDFKQKESTDEPLPPSRSSVHDDTNAVKDQLRRVTEIDYGKWDAFADAMESEERARQAAAAREKEAERMAVAGCAHDHSDERQIYEKPTEEKLKAAERFRQEGNAAYKDKNYGLAAVFYRKALLQFDYTFPDTKEEQEWFDREKLACHLNMALCKIQQKDWEEGLIQCRLALKVDSSNVKALYRRGLIYLEQDAYDEANEALTKALELDGGTDKAIVEAISKLRIKRKEYLEKRQKVFTKMMRAGSS